MAGEVWRGGMVGEVIRAEPISSQIVPLFHCLLVMFLWNDAYLMIASLPPHHLERLGCILIISRLNIAFLSRSFQYTTANNDPFTLTSYFGKSSLLKCDT